MKVLNIKEGKPTWYLCAAGVSLIKHTPSWSISDSPLTLSGLTLTRFSFFLAIVPQLANSDFLRHIKILLEKANVLSGITVSQILTQTLFKKSLFTGIWNFCFQCMCCFERKCENWRLWKSCFYQNHSFAKFTVNDF